MTYSDSNPERRNLTILSLAIIIFYLGQGYLLKPEVSFTLINIGFHNQSILIKLVWSLLFWFLFRYVVTNRHSYADELKETGVLVNMNYAPIRTYLKKIGQEKFINKLNNVKIYRHNHSAWYIEVSGTSLPLNGGDGYLITKLYLLKTIFKHRAASDYYSPYIVFLLAVSLGVNEHLHNITSILPILIIALILMSIEVLYYIKD